jgi:hypothetical protein
MPPPKMPAAAGLLRVSLQLANTWLGLFQDAPV